MTRQTDISDYGHAVRIARFGGCKTSLDAITKCRASRDRKPFDHDTGPRPAGYTTIRNLDCLRNQECLSTCIRISTKLCLSALFFRRMTSRIQLSDACAPTDLTKERCVDSRPHRIQLFHQVFPSRPHLSRPLARISIPVSHFPQGRGEGQRGPSNEGVRREGR